MKGKIILIGIFVNIIPIIGFCNSERLWDFGVVIETKKNNQDSVKYSYNNNSELNQNIKTSLANNFIKPLKTNMSISTIKKNKLYYYDYNKFQIYNEIKKKYFIKNYKLVIELIKHLKLNFETQFYNKEIKYLLINSLYHMGYYDKALNEIFSLSNYQLNDNNYFLIAMIYESMGEKNLAKKYYLELINKFPNSDYKLSAKIKCQIID
tara:strand:+ start:155 stop:778 length:624 start_codon:yes stop_codon:yes gene_type:complete